MKIDLNCKKTFTVIDIDVIIKLLREKTGEEYIVKKNIPFETENGVVYKDCLTKKHNLLSVKEIFKFGTAVELELDKEFPLTIQDYEYEKNNIYYIITIPETYKNIILIDPFKLEDINLAPYIFEVSNDKNISIDLSTEPITNDIKMAIEQLVEYKIEKIIILPEQEFRLYQKTENEQVLKFKDKPEIILSLDELLDYQKCLFIKIHQHNNKFNCIILNKKNKI